MITSSPIKAANTLKASLLFLLLLPIPGCSPLPVNNAPLKGSVDLQGHRGARGMRPENSIPAFIYCIEQGMDTVELDTNLTADGKLIVYHDSELNKELCLTQEGKAAKGIPVRSLTVQQLKTYDCGAVKNKEFPRQKAVKGLQMPTLDEFFEFVKEYEKRHSGAAKVRFNIEIKFPEKFEKKYLSDSAAEMVRTIERAGMASRTTVQSFIPEALPPVKKKNPAIRTSALFKPTYWKGFKMILGLQADRKEIIRKTVEVKADIISPYYLYVTPAFVKECHDRRIEVLPWTVNSEEKMIKMFDAGVDGIISDYPGLLKKTYLKWKKSRGE